MSRPTTLWEDLGIGVLAGATIVLTSAIWVLLASEGGVMLMNQGGPSPSELYVAKSDGTDGLWEDAMPRFVPKAPTAAFKN